MLFFGTKKNKRKTRSRNEPSFLRQILLGFLIFISIGLLLFLVWHVVRMERFQIENIIVVGGETISHDEVRARVENELVGTYFLLIPRKFAYLYPHDQIVATIERIPRTHDVIVSRDSQKTLRIIFAEYEPHAMWCTNNQEEKQCYFIDTSGYVFGAAPALAGGTFTRHSVEGVDSITVGDSLDKEKLADIDTFIQRTQEKLRLRITSVLHKKNNDLEFFINGGGRIFTTSKNDFETTFENLETLLSSKEFKHLKPGGFDYIDVRFNNKVFVKEEIGTTTESVPALSE